MNRHPVTPDRQAALLSLQRGLTGDRVLAGTAYMDDPAMLAAYSNYYLEVSRAQTHRICSMTGLRPRSVLDMGAGPGSVSLAFAERGASSLTLVDRSAPALESARLALAGLQRQDSVPLDVTVIRAELESSGATPPGLFDLVVFGHSLNEIGTGPERLERRLALVRRAAASLEPDGCILIIEPATLAASRDTLQLRDALVALGWYVRAPCTWCGACPALQAGPTHTCHDESTWDMPAHVGQLALQLGLDRELIKMTWVLVSPPSAVSEKSGAYRVVSAPMLNKGGRVRYLLCGPAGRFPFSARNGDDAATRGGFFMLRRYDLIEVANPGIREGGWGFGPQTTIRVLGPTEALARRDAPDVQ